MFFSLTVKGTHVDIAQTSNDLKQSFTFHPRDEHRDSDEEEIFEQEGLIEEVFAIDYDSWVSSYYQICAFRFAALKLETGQI